MKSLFGRLILPSSSSRHRIATWTPAIAFYTDFTSYSSIAGIDSDDAHDFLLGIDVVLFLNLL
jgi:hypothetical protein